MRECTICEAREGLINHHISYSDDETVPVCRSCHGRIHHNPNHDLFPKDLPPWRGRKVEVNYTPISINVEEKIEESPPFLQSRLLEGFEEWQVRWILNFAKMPEGRNIGVAYCERVKEPCFICAKGEANYSLKPLIIRDVYVKDGSSCEDEDFCFNFDCELSHPSVQKFQKYFTKKAKKENVKHLFELIRNISSKAVENLDDIFYISGVAYTEPPIEVNYAE